MADTFRVPSGYNPEEIRRAFAYLKSVPAGSQDLSPYALLAGATFTGVVNGIAPTSSSNLTTKAYVDSTITGTPGGYVNRGNPVGNDFTIGDLTIDGNFHALDLSSIIPVGATAVIIRTVVRASSANRHMRVRKNGDSNNINLTLCRTQVADIFYEFQSIIPVDSDYKIEYSLTGDDLNVASIAVLGWFLSDSTTGDGDVRNTKRTTSNYSVLTSDYTIIADGSSNTVTLTLPASPITGQVFNMSCLNRTFAVDVNFNGKNYYDSSSNKALFKGENLTVQFDGTEWVGG